MCAYQYTKEELLAREQKAVLKRSESISQFYSLDGKSDIHEISEALVKSDKTPSPIKKILVSTQRRIFVFNYPSNGLKVKGYISFVPNAEHNPLLILLRGGNRMLGLMPPATDLSCMRNYTVIATTYRGGISEGLDEFGVSDLDDVSNLMNYFPRLKQKLNIAFTPKATYMLGISRGAMEMFLSLAKFPELQAMVHKAASLTGILDMKEFIQNRHDMQELFVQDFGLNPLQNYDEWVRLRNPIDAIRHIRTTLPFLILQGTDDIRVTLNNGLHMKHKLQEQGNSVTYVEIPHGDHCLTNVRNRSDLIADWFEQI